MEDASIYPFSPLLEKWKVLHCKVARGSGGEPAAGKQLHAWARKAGFDPAKMEKGVRATSYLTPEETRSFAQSWNERLKDSEFRSRAVQSGAANEEEVDAIAQGWLDWAADEDAWFALMQGEIIARV